MNQALQRISSKLSGVVIPLVIVLVGLAGFVLLQQLSKDPPTAEQADDIVTVETATARAYSGPIGIEVNGIVVPYREIVVSSELEGVVNFKAPECQAGSFVTKGEVLVGINEEDYAIEVQRLEAEVKQSETMIEELKAEIEGAIEQQELVLQEVEVLKSELDRAEDLQGVLSQSDRDRAMRNWLTARNSLSVVGNNLRVLQTRENRMAAALSLANKKLEKAKLDAKRTQIRAPADGVVIEERVEPGSFVSRGTPLFVFEDTSKVEIECSLRVDELARILENAPVQSVPYAIPHCRTFIEFSSGETTVRWEGKLARYNGVGLDDKTRTVPCIVEVEDENMVGTILDRNDEITGGIRRLVRGMYVKLCIEVQPIRQMVAIPAVALASRDEVWVVRDGKLFKQRVRLARSIEDGWGAAIKAADPQSVTAESPGEDMVVIYTEQRRLADGSVQGLMVDGTTVVTSPPGTIVEGMDVEVVEGSLP